MDQATVEGRQPSWFVVRTQVHQEHRSYHQLCNQGFEVFLPLIERSVRHARKIRSVRAPLFPGYLFIQLDLSRDQWRCVNSTFGVSSLIMAGEQPRPVPKGVVERFIDLTQANGLVDFAPGLKAGACVEMVTGPFAGLIGQLTKCDGRGRVEILLEVMGQQVRVKATADALMPA
jgi:transcriptional antiterminator RfaH